MDFLAANRRVAESAPVCILFATNLVAIVRPRIALWDVAYLMIKDVARWCKVTALAMRVACLSLPPFDESVFRTKREGS
jgi:hypothetical protein